ncbi:ankyrin repeat, SAM and basic leucine zipper domain-containing protein 1 [Ceratina calcarata]|uniref:Ankyrin repeat, SAM and basic leucine zipper domain-containing protein 1 n=1 Tax=Ceratina calcarata TaxID=156304 RepID=A0AAJ7JEP4_9HYME|nr:ankyrin repeat, SAM and basic leucine zipper domain-containing protein 1 [Ceratina calcarata]
MYVDEEAFESHVINACTEGQLSAIADYLESHEVDQFLTTGWTLLLYAASEGRSEIIEYLTNNGADVNRHKEGYTPLMALCNCSRGTTEERMKCLTLLIALGADVNTSDKRRQTALMYACKSQEPEFLIELLKHVKDINASDNRNQTALMYATIANRPEIVQLLMEHTADATLTDCNDLTASDIAAEKGYDKILSLLNYRDTTTEEETTDTYEISKLETWRDQFPSLTTIDERTVDSDVYTMLHAMNLDSYTCNFRGISLKTFLQLTDKDLMKLGMDIRAHRVWFMEKLHEFHCKEWSVKSLGKMDPLSPYTLYDGIISLGTTVKQLAVIGSSFSYVRNNLLESYNDTNLIDERQRRSYEEEMEKAEKSLATLEKELTRMKNFSNKKRKENEIPAPTYIGPKKEHKANWPVFFSITLIVGICVYKTNIVPRLIYR